jgi:geranylgeranyl pyrophosphate synthase
MTMADRPARCHGAGGEVVEAAWSVAAGPGGRRSALGQCNAVCTLVAQAAAGVPGDGERRPVRRVGTRAARAAASIEMLHAYSLVHDDLPAMDDDDLRGQALTHKELRGH